MKNPEKQARRPVLSCGFKTLAVFAALALLVAAGGYIGSAVLFVTGHLQSLALSFVNWITVNKTDVLPATLTVWVSLIPVVWLLCLGYMDLSEDSDKGFYFVLAGFGLFSIITEPAGAALLAMPDTAFHLVHEAFLSRLAGLTQIIGAFGLLAWGLIGFFSVGCLMEVAVALVSGEFNSALKA